MVKLLFGYLMLFTVFHFLTKAASYFVAIVVASFSRVGVLLVGTFTWFALASFTSNFAVHITKYYTNKLFFPVFNIVFLLLFCLFSISNHLYRNKNNNVETKYVDIVFYTIDFVVVGAVSIYSACTNNIIYSDLYYAIYDFIISVFGINIIGPILFAICLIITVFAFFSFIKISFITGLFAISKSLSFVHSIKSHKNKKTRKKSIVIDGSTCFNVYEIQKNLKKIIISLLNDEEISYNIDKSTVVLMTMHFIDAAVSIYIGMLYDADELEEHADSLGLTLSTYAYNSLIDFFYDKHMLTDKRIKLFKDRIVGHKDLIYIYKSLVLDNSFDSTCNCYDLNMICRMLAKYTTEGYKFYDDQRVNKIVSKYYMKFLSSFTSIV